MRSRKVSMKRFTAICLSILMFASSITVHANEDYSANSWRYRDGEPIVSDQSISLASDNSMAWVKENGVIYNGVGDPIPNAISKGIDVSEWQGNIDWDRVRNTDVEFAIIRCGFAGNYSKYDDKKFVRNVKECQRLGIPFGVYLYSYAQDVEDAKDEANHTLRLLQGLNLSYPVFYDLEENSVMSTVSKSTIAKVAETYVSMIKAAGYNCGVYANLYWFNNYLTDPYFDSVMKWVAQYNVECNYQKYYSMWQGTSSGYVDGIAGNVDINVTFDSMQQMGWVQEKDGWYYYSNDGTKLTSQWIGNYYVGEDGKMLTNQWIGDYYVDANGLWSPDHWINNDGKWWYRHQDGTYTKNDFEVIDNQTYYFDNDGYRVTGWKKVENDKYYFNASGIMATDQWINTYYYVDENGKMVKNKWLGIYYLDSNGVWQPDRWIYNGRWWYRYGDGSYPVNKFDVVNNNVYYFDSNGYVVSGWQVINGNWYYFNGSGAMLKSQWIGNYYVGKDGIMAKSQWIGNDYVDSNGVWTPARWVFDGQWWYRYGDGSYPTHKFDTINGYTYYFNDAGYVLTGWNQINNQWYYFNGNGSMIKNAWVGNYYLGSDGKMV